MTRRAARAIERSAIAEVRRDRRSTRSAQRRSSPQGGGARRVVVGAVAGFAALAFLGATIAPALAPHLTQASQQFPEQPEQSTYEAAAADAQVFAATSNSTSLGSLASVSYTAVLNTPEPEPEPAPAVVADIQGGGAPADDQGAAPEPAPAPAPVQPPVYDGGGGPSEWMAAAGIAESDWGYVDYIVSKESGWNPGATNPTSGACGLVQAYPCSKVPGDGYNPIDNLVWGNGYAIARYGSWANAYNFWIANHWW
nr:lytic transglycosylase domain-containing protein [Microbacterium amylolyticum]